MSSGEQQLLSWFTGLSADDQRSLMDYAQFLAQRSSGHFQPADPDSQTLAPVSVEPEPLPEPEPIPRPESEKVIAAIKRLSQTYYMLDKSKMLNHTSGLMTEHVMARRDAREVIDELEVVFREQYEAFCQAQEK